MTAKTGFTTFRVFMLAFPKAAEKYGKTRQVDVPTNELTGNLDHDLEKIFHYGQNDFQPKEHISVSGDDVIEYKGEYYRVAFIGFEKIEDSEELKAILKDIPLSCPRKIKSYSNREYLILTDELKAELNNLRHNLFDKIDKTATDQGTCVMGAGIKIQVFESSRKKFPTSVMLMRAPFQGNVGSYNALKPVLEYLTSSLPELHAYWEDGNMD